MPLPFSIRPRSTPPGDLPAAPKIPRLLRNPGDHSHESAPDPLHAFLLPAGLLTGLVAALYLLEAPPAAFWAAVFFTPFLLILLMEV